MQSERDSSAKIQEIMTDSDPYFESLISCLESGMEEVTSAKRPRLQSMRPTDAKRPQAMHATSNVDANAAGLFRLSLANKRIQEQEEEIAVLHADLYEARENASRPAAPVGNAQLASAMGVLEQQRAALEQHKTTIRNLQADNKEACRLRELLQKEYAGVIEDRARLAGQLEETTNSLIAAANPDEERRVLDLYAENAALRAELSSEKARAGRAARAAQNELEGTTALAEGRMGEIERMQQDLEVSSTALEAARRDAARADELEVQLSRLQTETRQQKRLGENADVVRSLQSALRAQSSELREARGLRQKLRDSEALKQELADLTSRFARAEQALKHGEDLSAQHAASLDELGRWRAAGAAAMQTAGPLTPEIALDRIQQLHQSNLRQAAECDRLRKLHASAVRICSPSLQFSPTRSHASLIFVGVSRYSAGGRGSHHTQGARGV